MVDTLKALGLEVCRLVPIRLSDYLAFAGYEIHVLPFTDGIESVADDEK